MSHRLSTITGLAVVLAALTLAAPMIALAQNQPALVINDVTVPFETDGGAGLATFTVTFTDTAVTHGPVTVSFSTTGGTATTGTSCGGAGVDYVGVNGSTLAFGSTEKRKEINITVCGDARDEADETFFVNLFGANGAGIQDAQGQATLIDDDPPPSLRVNDVTLTEGAAGTVASAVFTVTVTGLSQNPITVSYATANRTATTGSCGTPNVDYATTAGSLTLAPGQASQTITIPVCGDGVREGNEQFEVRFSGGTVTIQDGTGVGTITDDEPLPALSIVAAVEIAKPGKGQGVNLPLPVTLIGPDTEQEITVNFATEPGTATAGGTCLTNLPGLQRGDYVTRTGTLRFAPGTRVQQIQVGICGSGGGSNETFTVRLSGASNAQINQATGTATIQ